MSEKSEDVKIYFLFDNNLHKKSLELLEELMSVIPNSVKSYKNSDEMKYLNYIKVHEDIGPQYLIINQPNFSRIVFKIIHFKSRADLGFTKQPIISKNYNLVLNNFTSDLGIKVANQLMEIYSDCKLNSNQVINFSVHKDFIYFRFYRFKISVSKTDLEKEKVLFHQLGPQLTLRLWRMTEVIEGKEKIYNYEKYIKHANLL